MQAVILAAGRGKRLHPLTLTRSKAMLPVLGKPMLARIIEAIAANSITNFVIVHSPTDQQIPAYFSKYGQSGLQISFVVQADPKGMAHALQQPEPLIQDDFILSACDSLLSQDDYASLMSAWQSIPKPSAVLSLLPVKPESDGSTALVRLQDGWVRQIIEKPQPDQIISNLSSLPIYLFNCRIFPLLEQLQPSARGELELQDGIQSLISQYGNVRGVFVSSRMNLTSARDLLEINLQFLRCEDPKIIQEPAQISSQATLIPPFFIGPNTTIAEGCTIGPNVYIESDCSIAKNCRISEAVLLQGSFIERGQTLKYEVIAANWTEHNHR